MTDRRRAAPPATFDNVAEIAAVLARLDDPPTVGELLTVLADHFGVDTLTARWLERVIVASDGQLTVGSDGLVRAAQPATVTRPARIDPAEPGRPLRLVAVDFETLPRHRDDGSIERVPMQAGAARFGRDSGWVAAAGDVEELVACDPALAALHPDNSLLADAVGYGRPADQVADLLAEVLDGADIVVAYNGSEVDHPVLTALLRGRHDTLLDALVPVDAMYLAHAIWPRRAPVTLPDGRTHSAHTLEAIATRAGVWRLQSHRALDDCRLLIDVLEAAARLSAGWPAGLSDVIHAATRNSHAWALLADLGGGRPRTSMTAADVRATLTAAFAALPPERAPGPAGHDDDTDHTPTITVDESLRSGGRVDPYRLVAASRPDAARRTAQEATAAAVRDLVDSRTDGLLEAPTGSGKSMVLLAEALEWVAGGPGRRAIISTYTKQLQTQLAEDLDRLTGVLPGLADNVDLVKGAANRLSLRSLVAAVTALATGVPHRTGISPRLAADPTFAELVAYLLLRLVTLSPATDGTPRIADVWAARSVDRVDLPGAFDRWTAGSLPRFLAELSQGRTGDWAERDGPLAPYTLRVREALQRRRLIVANHALLCSTATVLADIGEHSDMLLLVDEAHELEAAATSTLSASFDYAGVEALVADLETIAARESRRITAAAPDPDPDTAAGSGTAGSDGDGDAEIPADERRRRFVAAVNDIVALLRSEQLPAAVAATFGMRSGTDMLYGRAPRSVAVADEDADGGQLARAATIEQLLRVAVGRLATVAEHLDRLPAAGDPDETDERATARARLVDTLVAAAVIRSDLAELVGVDPDDSDDGDTAAALIAADSDLEAAPAGQAGNRLVWATEGDLSGARLDRFIEHGMSLRWWPFTLTTTPIAVAADPRWHTLRSAFTATVFTSGTLTVPGADDRWAFIRGRLGLANDIAATAIASDFDPAAQALLVAFSDFPSWAEQPKAAAASVAWQVARFAREGVTADGDHGALVLTTSRAASNDIADRLVALRDPDDRHHIHSAALDGNAGATAKFRDHGGLLVGTRGLWQGVDLPAERLRMVWINKLPFPTIGDPVLEARRRRVEQAARDAGAADPESQAMADYYLPLAAIGFRQAVGRLLRSPAHRGVVVVSDAKLSGDVRLRRLYRRMFLGSLDDGYATPDPETGEVGAGNVTTMEDGWARVWQFLARPDVATLTAERAAQLSSPEALAEHVWLPETRRIRAQRMTDDNVADARRAGTLGRELVERGQIVGAALRLEPGRITLKTEQQQALAALAEGRDVIAILPTGFGKSFLFQLPGLILPGVTIVVSPLVSLMTDQALKLNRSVGGQVRALTGPMRESNSRMGKAQVLQQLTGQADHGIKLVYMSPERLATAQFQGIVEAGVANGTINMIAFDEAHTLAAWGDSFRPAIRRAEHFIRRLRERYGAPQLLAVTATATYSVRLHLLKALFDTDPYAPDPTIEIVTANPVRSDLAIYKRVVPARRTEAEALQVALVERMLDEVEGHAIIYCTTIKEVERIHGYLSGQTGRRRRVLKYHGRMEDLEKASVADYFTSAPRRGDPDGYKPMVVVATQAFGLGIDRDDIRLVLCASPPGDLSALYQAIGRAGRDRANQSGDALAEQTVGAAVLTPKAWSTLQWMNRHDPATGTLITAITDVIINGQPPLDVDALVDTMIDAGIAAGTLPDSAADDDYLHEAYRSLVVRTFAALADRGLVEDLGDAPVRATLLEGEILAGDWSDAAELARTFLDARPGGDPTVELDTLWKSLPASVTDELGDISSMWYELLALHATGHLDVSQKSNIGFGQTVNYHVNSIAVTPDLEDELLSLHRARVEDLQLMRLWFQADTTCALDGLADYFRAPPDATDGICEHDLTRCSVCWQGPAHAARPRPRLLEGLLTDIDDLRAALSKLAGVERRRCEKAIEELLADIGFGLGRRKLKAALRGEQYLYFGGRSQPLPRRVLRCRVFGQLPTLEDAPLDAALSRLSARGRIVQVIYDHGGVTFQHPTAPVPDGAKLVTA